MDNSELMQVLDTTYDLLEEVRRFILLELLFLNDVVEEFASTDVFHNKKELLGRLYYFEKLYNVRMPNELENIDLPCDSEHVCILNDLPFLENLDCDLEGVLIILE